MRILTALITAGLLFAAAGCHDKKNDKTTPGSTMGDGGAEQHPAYPPAQ